ncbi:RNA 2'-phosphotransferase [Hoeflea sp. WL0058]|uniref:Probable RNA 2'-phosphotransferase n=1 Tax=Flavimaribacter sediminis TaxID=2865987 RepID=A0AAE3D3C0_9HYPH|nr:RNA 2'-phosphotransferase [Flavimaribacter sediminis]MBW8639488.1 RNA 2'-phosphotransferase [Flavimaribacter sediminis]
MTQSETSISKFLSYVRRHKPDAVGLELDPEGWAYIDELIAKSDIPITRDQLLDVVAKSDKQRFALSADGLFIRANQGHSIKVDLGLQPLAPPEFLFHGTATRFLHSIMKHGVLPRNRQYVHLSGDRETAVKVGQRHGKPVVLTIPALKMHQQGAQFFQARNGVWLTNEIAPQYLEPAAT